MSFDNRGKSGRRPVDRRPQSGTRPQGQRNEPQQESKPVTRITAPYNFVPFSDKVVYRYDNADQLPQHDRIDPDLHTGEIQITLTAQTPLLVSSGKGSEKEHDKEKDRERHPFRDAKGRYAIPGSSLRGLIRQTMQILSFGKVTAGEDLEDIFLYYREIAGARTGSGGPLKETYRTALGLEGEDRNPNKVQIGYLRCEEDHYYIQPAKGELLSISRKHEDAVRLAPKDATLTPVWYQPGDQGRARTMKSSAAEGLLPGTLLATGKTVGRGAANSLYIFPEADESADPVPISKRDLLSYAADFEMRKNSLKAYYNPDFWKLPEGDESKPVFYIHHDGHVFFGMSRFLRIGYPQSLEAGLPARHREVSGGIDYPHAMFGFVGGGGEQPGYRSRVSFETLTAVGNPKEMTMSRAALLSPKPTFYPGYVKDGNHYGEPFLLRGYKLYWFQSPHFPIPEKDGDYVAQLFPLPSKTTFRGIVRFKNLSDDELGLLLWALELDEGCCHGLGMGKPYGLGQVKITVDAVREARPEELYSVFDAAPRDLDTAERARLVRCFEAEMKERMYLKGKKTLRDRPEIKDFLFLRSTFFDEKQHDQVAYLKLKSYKDAKNENSILTTVAKMRERSEAEQREEPEEGLSLAEQLARFNRSRGRIN